jgi:hypothetical protein
MDRPIVAPDHRITCSTTTDDGGIGGQAGSDVRLPPGSIPANGGQVGCDLRL